MPARMSIAFQNVCAKYTVFPQIVDRLQRMQAEPEQEFAVMSSTANSCFLLLLLLLLLFSLASASAFSYLLYVHFSFLILLLPCKRHCTRVYGISDVRTHRAARRTELFPPTLLIVYATKREKSGGRARQEIGGRRSAAVFHRLMKFI